MSTRAFTSATTDSDTKYIPMAGQVVSIGSNVSSLRAQRHLTSAAETLKDTFSKLSSGLRVTRASDDAAGLAIAASLAADTRIYTQGRKNLNDGISLLNIADATLDQLSLVATRIRELAAQASNGTLGWKQRQSIDQEAQTLAAEYTRIAKTAKFNGISLFDGSLGQLRLQAGYGAEGGVAAGLGGTMGDGTFKGKTSYTMEAPGFSPAALAVSDINSDGIADLVTAGSRIAAAFGIGDGTFAEAKLISSGESLDDLLLSDLNNDGRVDLITGKNSGFDVRLGNGDGTFRAADPYVDTTWGGHVLSVGDINGDGAFDIISGAQFVGGTQTSIRLGNGNGTFQTSSEFLMPGLWASAFSLADLNQDGALDLAASTGATYLGNGNGTFRAPAQPGGSGNAISLADINGDGFLDSATAGGGGPGTAFIRLGKGDGTFQAGVGYEAEGGSSYAISLSDMNGDGLLDLVTAGNAFASGRATMRLGNGDGTFRASTPYLMDTVSSDCLALSDLNGDGVPDLITAGNSRTATVRLANTREGISPLLPFSLRYQADALQALPALDRTLANLTVQRGIVGAFQSRVKAAMATLGASVESFSAARSRIEDADIAGESATLVRQQIIQNAAASVLAQANTLPNLAITLLS